MDDTYAWAERVEDLATHVAGLVDQTQSNPTLTHKLQQASALLLEVAEELEEEEQGA